MSARRALTEHSLSRSSVKKSGLIVRILANGTSSKVRVGRAGQAPYWRDGPSPLSPADLTVILAPGPSGVNPHKESRFSICQALPLGCFRATMLAVARKLNAWGVYRPWRNRTDGLCAHCGERERAPTSHSYCHQCRAEYVRLTRTKHSQLSTEQRRRANCRSYANVYLRRGKITREPCERCGGTAEMHHDDYSEPLQVRWLCRSCHLELHAATV